jgi:hypothetical protein
MATVGILLNMLFRSLLLNNLQAILNTDRQIRAKAVANTFLQIAFETKAA